MVESTMLNGSGQVHASDDDFFASGDPDEPDAPPVASALDAALIERVTSKLLGGVEIAKELPPLEYLCAPMALTAGSGPPHLVAGYGFSGKTVAMQSLALSLANGSSIWGAFTAQKRRVLHVDLEQGERLTRRRYQRLAFAMGIDLPTLGDDLALLAMPGISLCLAHLEVWARLMGGRDLMIVDSLRVAQPGAEENSSDFRGGLDMLGALSERTKCRAIVIHHARKAGDDKPAGMQSIRGSSAILGACDSVYVFGAAKGEPIEVEPVKTREHGEPPPAWALTIADVPSEDGADMKAGLSVSVRGHEAVAEARAKTQERTRKIAAGRDADKLMAYVRSNPGSGRKTICEVLAISGARYAAAMAELSGSVAVRSEKEGRGWVSKHYAS